MLLATLLVPARTANTVPTPPASGDALVETHNVINQGSTPQFQLKLWHNGLTFTDDGIESTGELSYSLRVTERFTPDPNDLRATRNLFPKEERHPDGTVSYYVEYAYLPASTSNLATSCRNFDSLSAEQKEIST